MHLTPRELWTAVHGLLFGGAFLLAFTGALAALRALRADWLTPAGQSAVARTLIATTWFVAILVWLTVLLGTYVIYPWYRAKAPPNATPAQLAAYPKYLLLSDPHTADWHEFGMEWKEHVAWLSPLLATAIAVVVTRHRHRLANDALLRRTLVVLLLLCFAAAAIPGLLGALINKAAPLR